MKGILLIIVLIIIVGLCYGAYTAVSVIPAGMTTIERFDREAERTCSEGGTDSFPPLVIEGFDLEWGHAVEGTYEYRIRAGEDPIVPDSSSDELLILKATVLSGNLKDLMSVRGITITDENNRVTGDLEITRVSLGDDKMIWIFPVSISSCEFLLTLPDGQSVQLDQYIYTRAKTDPSELGEIGR